MGSPSKLDYLWKPRVEYIGDPPQLKVKKLILKKNLIKGLPF